MGEYLVLLYQDESRFDRFEEAEQAELLAAHLAFQQKHGAAVVAGEGLQRSSTARSIQVDDGSLAVTDGPFVETKEVLGGFYLIEAGDLDEAIAIAKDIPAPYGGVEVRPTMVLH